MSTVSVTYTFTNGTSAEAAEVNENFSDLVAFINASVMHTDGGDFSVLPTSSVAPTTSTQLTPKSYVDSETVTTKAYADTQDNLRALAAHSHTTTEISALDAGDVTTGSFAVARIPSLAASILTSGTVDVARVPSLPASKTTSGTFDAARIPSLAASILTSGTFGINLYTSGHARVGTGKKVYFDNGSATFVDYDGANANLFTFQKASIQAATLGTNGITYTASPVSGTNAMAFTWDGTNVKAYVDGTYVGNAV